ncbi:MAG: NADH-quinone oxidoreductase subunit C [Acidobacteriota bacterium]
MTETPITPPAKPAAPVGRSLDELRLDPLIATSVAGLNGAITNAREFAGEITLIVDAARIVEVTTAFKKDGWNYLVDLAGVDYSKYPGHTGPRFGVSYTLYSFARNARVRIRALTDGSIPSISSVWKTANWHERETWDMFGIVFEGHPNLERILMWDGFNGHPLRKDFPIRGIDTGARIYPEVFPEGGGPKAGSTGKDVKDVNLYKGQWDQYGKWPPAQIAGGSEKKAAPAPELAGVVADSAVPTPDAPWHDPDKPLTDRMELAKAGSLKDKLFAAMAQTDCTACGWDCEGYAEAIAKGESKDLTLCVPGEAETESMLKLLMAQAGRA